MTNADLTTAKVASETDISNIYTTDGADNLTMGAGKELFISSGSIFNQGADVITTALDIRGTYVHGADTLIINNSYTHSQGTFTGGSGTINVNGGLTINAGNFTSTSGILRIQNSDNAGFTVNSGSFNHNSGTVEFATPSNYKTLTVDIGTTILNDVIVNGSGKAYLDITDTMDIDGALTITSIGKMLSGTMDVAGNIVTTDTDITGDATLLLAGSNVQTINAGGESGDLTRLTINKSGGGSVNASAAGTLGVENLTVSGGTFIAPSGILRIENTDDEAFAVSGGTFSHNSGTVEFATPSNYKTLTVDIGTTILNDVIVNGSGKAYLDITDTMDIDGALTITSINQINGGAINIAKNLA